VKNSRAELGLWGEETACDYMLGRGARLLRRNFRSRSGEIDLIFEDQECLVFLEVRTRKASDFLDPLESIDARKQKKIRSTASLYYNKIWKQDSICRFDVIAIIGEPGNYKLNHIEDAF
jgi:putative endonuclease